MIAQLEIKNFRGFSEYKIDDVGQVNLLVGTNNCGKTSVLEAIHLLKSRGEFSAYLDIVNQRGENDGQKVRVAKDFRSLFYGFKFDSSSVFSIQSDKEEQLMTSIRKGKDNSMYMYPPDDREQLNIICNVKKKEKEAVVFFENDGMTQREYKPTLLSPENTKFVPAYSLTTQKVITLFDMISLLPDEEFVLEAIRIIEPDIVRLVPVGGKTFSEKDTRGGFFVKSSKWDERIPIGSFGDGIWRLLGLALSLVGAKDGTLLIDEIDTGLHHTVMSKMWKLICATAKKLNVQVFATTHSSDCWKTLADNAVEDEFADMPIRIHRINKDRKQAETFTNEEMHLALNRDIEVR
ncbi:ATP/GTP-binding protein [Desulfobulbus sp. F5]|nr:ATP/GTP-binding protein [Desulfobulbus sp. F5]